MRVHFSEGFSIQSGSITPRVQVHLNGITMGTGISFGGGVLFGGVDLSLYVNRDLEAEQDQSTGIVTITGFYD